MHRGYEKLTEVRTYPQVTTLINRIDWLSSFANEVPFILAAEKLMEVDAPPRAQWIRTILFEIARIANISLFLGEMGLQLGAITPAFLAFRDREHVLNLIEAATGGRFHPNYDRIGGIKDDLPKGWIDETKGVMKKLRDFCDELETLVAGNEIFQARTPRHRRHPAPSRPRVRPVRAPTSAPRASTGTSAATASRRWPGAGRLEGLDAPRRRQLRPLLGAPPGDAGSPRTSSTSCSTACPPGPIMAKVPQIIKVPAGEAWVQHREPARRDGLLHRQQGRPRPVPVQDPLGVVHQHVDRAVGAARASSCPTSSRSWPASTSSSETSTDDAGGLEPRRTGRRSRHQGAGDPR